MSSRRLEKIARVIRESVSETVNQRLNDPRISGIISVTEVSVAPDLKNATVLFSIMSPDETSQRQTFEAIRHAAGVIQFYLGRALATRRCPHLRFEMDTKMQQTLRTLEMIDKAAEEFHVDDKDDYDDDESPLPEP